MKKISILILLAVNFTCLFSQEALNEVDTINRNTPVYLQKHHINYRGNLNNSRLIFVTELPAILC